MHVASEESIFALRRRLEMGFEHFASSLVARALLSNGPRKLVLDTIERRLIAAKGVFANPNLPSRAEQDKLDMAKALLESTRRALEREQLSYTVVHRMLKVFLVNTLLRQDPTLARAEEEFGRRHLGQRPPGLIVISPTKTCNLQCIGCYASSNTTREHLEWDVLDRIVVEAKSLWGVRFFTISGGEPFLYRSQGKDLLDLASSHSDCFFMTYTNGTLIDSRLAERMAKTGNLTPAISLEGFQSRTDARRGPGVFDRILKAMANLRKAGVPFGISLTATRDNAEEILSDKFLDFFFEEQQAVYGWLFQYMPIGRSYTLDLLVSPEQRLQMWRRTWQIIRERKILLADFWNCGTVSNGCIAAGQAGGGGYLYIDWNGKVMPCVFVPYAAANIHKVFGHDGTLDNLFDLPYFQGIRQWQADYVSGGQRTAECGNLLRPCSLRDHYDAGRRLIDQYHPEPEDVAAAQALEDEDYRNGLLAYDRQLKDVFDPIWEQQYLHGRTNELPQVTDEAL